MKATVPLPLPLLSALLVLVAPALAAQDPGATELAGNLSVDPLVGTYVGRNMVGPVTVDILREEEGDGYVVVDRSSTASMSGTGTMDDDGVLRGEYVTKVFGFTRRHKFEITPLEGGLRYKIPGATITIERYARTDDNPQSKQWLATISGHRWAWFDRYSSGTSGGYTSERNLYLCADGTFQYSTQSSTSLTGDGISASSNSRDGGRGTWRVRTQLGQTSIELRFTDGSVEERAMTMDGEAIQMDGRRWVRGQNTVCP